MAGRLTESLARPLSIVVKGGIFVENMQIPFSQEDLNSALVRENLEFLSDLEKRVQSHGVFDHPVLVGMAEGRYNQEFVKFFLSQFSLHVRVFTAALSALLGRAPDFKSRFVLFDNLYEEMGRGDFRKGHFMLYVSMLESLGVTEEELESMPPLCSITLLNDGLFYAVTQRPFNVGLAWLGLGGELTIPNNFPYMVQALKNLYSDTNVDWGFFDRHGGRDQMHSDDANLVLALYMEEKDRETIETEVWKSLAARKAVWDELESRAADF